MEISLPEKVEAPPSSAPSRFFLICFAIVGATAMSYEIGWTRLLSTQLGSSTYSFTLMLGTFLTGIVLGSALFERWSRRRAPGSMTFAVTQTLTALAALAFLVFFTRLIEVLPPILRATHESFRGLVLAQFVTSALAMLPTAVVFGFNSSPAVVVSIAGPKTSGSVGRRGGTPQWAAPTRGTRSARLSARWPPGSGCMPRLGSFHLLAATAGAESRPGRSDFLAWHPRSGRVLEDRCVLRRKSIALTAGRRAFIGFSNHFYDPAVAAFNTVMYWDLVRPAR